MLCIKFYYDIIVNFLKCSYPLQFESVFILLRKKWKYRNELSSSINIFIISIYNKKQIPLMMHVTAVDTDKKRKKNES